MQPRQVEFPSGGLCMRGLHGENSRDQHSVPRALQLGTDRACVGSRHLLPPHRVNNLIIRGIVTVFRSVLPKYQGK